MSQEREAEDVYLLVLHAPYIAEHSKPGQFVMVSPGLSAEKGGPLLRRPFSLHGFSSDGNISLLYRKVGTGTSLMSGLVPGQTVSVMGPLGRGYDITGVEERAYLVAGGLGIAPMPPLAKALEPACDVTIFYGAKTGSELIKGIFSDGTKVMEAAEDNSTENNGFVTHFLERALKKNPAPIFSCGPKPMLARVAELAKKYEVNAQVSLEERMACGIGLCQGCAVELIDPGSSTTRYGRVCADGPVFSSEEVVL